MANGKGKTIGIRIDPQLDEFLRMKSEKIGLSKSEYVRNLIVQGATAESVAEFEERMLAILDQMSTIIGIKPGTARDGMARFDKLALYECLGLLRINAAKSAPGDVKQAQAFANQMLEDEEGEGGKGDA